MCANGRCINMDGSFKCECDRGFLLSPTGFSCVGESQQAGVLLTAPVVNWAAL